MHPSQFPAMFAAIAVALAAGLLSWAYQTIKPPPPKICGSPGGPPITSPRVKLSDGRHLAYREMGVPKEEAKHKIIVIHGFDSSKDLSLPVSQETIEELSIYFLFFDRAGYGESDPYPSRSVKSEAYDIQELADQLQIGSKFYVIGLLSGASLVVPFVHYWWPSLPANISREGFQTLCTADQRTFQVAHHTPWLFYWWMTQKWFPSLSIMAGNMNLFSPPDMEIIKKLSETPNVGQEKVRQQGVHESLHRDILAGYAKWEFDIMDISNPFPNNEGSVHLWQGYEDRIIPFQINRYIAEKLPWIHYHEVPDAGHLMLFKTELCEAIFRALLLGPSTCPSLELIPGIVLFVFIFSFWLAPGGLARDLSKTRTTIPGSSGCLFFARVLARTSELLKAKPLKNLRGISATHLFTPNKRIAALGEFIRDIGLKMVSEIKSLAERNGEVLEIRKVLHFGSLNNVMMRVFGRSYESGDESKVDVCELEGLMKRVESDKNEDIIKSDESSSDFVDVLLDLQKENKLSAQT
ncbi:hypothetical protein NC653_012056 [Populus alba x Populus x berolinensis]|uniref:AB hydrolase-1 domain-containing protein n=2 Tax=Populus alba x Populus x berolinensis TaxID=444605 RepID=A0AAD6W756_9ROSI|nr:hypothetical protein NC653_012056 [Populus alba x Populus x berolinensis]